MGPAWGRHLRTRTKATVAWLTSQQLTGDRGRVVKTWSEGLERACFSVTVERQRCCLYLSAGASSRPGVFLAFLNQFQHSLTRLGPPRGGHQNLDCLTLAALTGRSPTCWAGRPETLLR